MPKLTKTAVDDAAPTDKEFFLWDADLRGFGLRVKPSGVKTYLIQDRDAQGRSKRLTIGQHGRLTCDEARKAAKTHLANTAVEAERYDQAASEVRRVVERINRDYPGLRLKLVSMFDGIIAVQELVWAVNRKRPAGKPAINGPEGTKGGFPDYAPGDSSPQALSAIKLTSSVLPSEESNRPAWPPLSAKRAWTFQDQVRLMPYGEVRRAWKAQNQNDEDE